MKVAIIGANGFIGSRLMDRMHLVGKHEVFPIVRGPASLALPARFQLAWRLGDALEVVALARALEGCDAVVHAAIGDPRQIEKMPAVLCEAAASAGVKRMVYLSSASVLGQNAPVGANENTPLHRRHSIEYNNAKVAAEQSFFAASHRYRVPGYVLRPGVVYGPRSRWIAELASDLRAGRSWLLRDGGGICNAIYVDNLVAAIELCLEAWEGIGEAYLVGDAETVKWADFYFQAADLLGVSPAVIHRLDAAPVFRKNIRDRLEGTVSRPWVQALLPVVPKEWKRGAKTLLTSWNRSGEADAWSAPESRPQPRVTEEMVLLQECQWKFPHAKAARILGYQPEVSFSEGMKRSMAWWRFASEGHL